MFAVVAGYHRYFSHRAFSTSRVFQFILGFLAQTSAQKSLLWWASKHRHHHLHADTDQDVHSPRQTGFLYSHVGWIFARKHDQADLSKVADLTRYPELMWLHKHELLPATILAALSFWIAGWSVLRNQQRLGTRIINRAAEQLAARFSAERIVLAIRSALQGPELNELQTALRQVRRSAMEAWAAYPLPHMPSRQQVMTEAHKMFAQTPSLDEIVDRAALIILTAVDARLRAGSLR